MANTLNLGTDGNWAVKKDSLLGYNSENGNFKPLPFEFERASSATVVNKAGLIETVGSGEPRIDYSDDANGALLLEPRSANLITQSQVFSGYSENNAVLVDNVIISPDGTLNGASFTDDNTGGTGIVQVLSNENVDVSSTYTWSIFAKKKGVNYIVLRPNAFTTPASGNTFFDLENGTVVSQATGHTAKIEDYGSGWYRCSITFTTDAVDTNGSLIARLSTTGSNTTLNLDGTNSIYTWGWSFEKQSYPTSYIPTQGSAVTRLADVCLQGGFQDKNIFGSTQGTAVFDIKWDELNYIFEFNVGGVEVIRIYNDNNTQWRIRDTTTSSWYYTGFNITQGQRTKIGFKWSGTEIVAFQNGVKSLNNGLIGSNTSVESITTNKLNNTSNMQFYNTALTDQELQQLTTI
ncbi:hypothetical protein N9Q05_01855 [bacterium]|nr:hypothetical protein [bacterium]